MDFFSCSRLHHLLNPYAAGGNLANTKWCKQPGNYWNPGKWVLIWEYSTRAIQWIPTGQGLDGFQIYLRSCSLDESCLSIGGVNVNFAIGSLLPFRYVFLLGIHVSHCVHASVDCILKPPLKYKLITVFRWGYLVLWTTNRYDKAYVCECVALLSNRSFGRGYIIIIIIIPRWCHGPCSKNNRRTCANLGTWCFILTPKSIFSIIIESGKWNIYIYIFSRDTIQRRLFRRLRRYL